MATITDIKSTNDAYSSRADFLEDYKGVALSTHGDAVYIGREDEGGHSLHRFVAAPTNTPWEAKAAEGETVGVHEVTLEAEAEADLDALARLASGAAFQRDYGFTGSNLDPRLIEDVEAALVEREDPEVDLGAQDWAKGISNRLESKSREHAAGLDL